MGLFRGDFGFFGSQLGARLPELSSLLLQNPQPAAGHFGIQIACKQRFEEGLLGSGIYFFTRSFHTSRTCPSAFWFVLSPFDCSRSFS